MHAETVADVLKESGIASSESEIVEITHKLNERNIFPADRAELAYVVREPIVNRALAGCVRRCVAISFYGRGREVWEGAGDFGVPLDLPSPPLVWLWPLLLYQPLLLLFPLSCCCT